MVFALGRPKAKSTPSGGSKPKAQRGGLNSNCLVAYSTLVS
ncbi:hypothetical protein BOTU111922_21985 [Bordetella tumulicola]